MTSRRRGSRRSANAASAPEARLDGLVVMRESSRYDRVLMEGMVHQTLAKVPDLPGAAELQAAGMDVFAHPERYGATLRLSGSSRIVMVERDGILYLYSMGTASTDDLEDANAFITELVRVVETYRPTTIWVAAFTRLLRSATYAGDLLKAFTEHAGMLHCEAEINLATPEGRMLFQVLAMIAATERDYLVRRHTAGRVAQCRRGEWLSIGYPPGYRLEDRRLVLDESRIDAVRQMLVLLADPALRPSECAARIGALGLSTPMIINRHGPDATISDARNPTEVLATLRGWVGLYATGRHTTLWPNPFAGVSHIAGVEVQPFDGYEHGALELVQEVPLPDGGWADDATLDAIRHRSEARSATGGASHAMAPPLSGMFNFDDGQHEYALRARRGAYELMRRPLRDDRRFPGWTCEQANDSEPLASIEREALHRSIADEVLAAVRDGLPADLDANHFQAAGPLPRLDARRARLRAVRRQLDDVTRDLERARRNANLADEDEVAALFVQDAEAHQATQKRLERELVELEDAIEEPELGTAFETNAELVAHAIAALRNAGDRVGATLREALRTVISKERWRLDDNVFHWELHLELPHRDGTVVLGPIRGAIPSRPARVRTRTPRPAGRDDAISELTAAGLSERAARSVAACPHPQLADVLLAHLDGRPGPPDIDVAWTRHIAAVYTDPEFHWEMGQWRLPDGPRRTLLAVIAETGGQLERDKILAAGVSTSQLRYLSRPTLGAPSGDPIVRRLGRGRDGAYTLIDCPHCGGHASHSVVTPETRPGVLCPDCWRAPVPDSPVFPEFYRS